MTKSMTAFTRLEKESVSWELRSVNHRYLDVTIKMPERLRSLEVGLRTALKKHLKRGKVDCLLKVEAESNTVEALSLNEPQLLKLIEVVKRAESIAGMQNSANIIDLVRWPGVLQEQQVDLGELASSVNLGFEEALVSLIDMRAREGAELGRIILEKLTELEAIVAVVRGEVPIIAARQKQKILDRLSELSSGADENRLEQELVYLAQKGDVAEELDRLDTHIEEIRGALASDEPSGRRLDFLMQELNREANTLSSKAVAANTSIQAVELKVIIEQMREQIQNIE
ncbi:MAG: YicC/YloC family endoribonuclease [Pseudomonadales bacterium]|jgi:uncharacterized protein (TIGR00255 family)|tara:strand:+ start:6146 stop:7000 length:855 start_codon:yes stop_codon:yes gene_type:complete